MCDGADDVANVTLAVVSGGGATGSITLRESGIVDARDMERLVRQLGLG